MDRTVPRPSRVCLALALAAAVAGCGESESTGSAAMRIGDGVGGSVDALSFAAAQGQATVAPQSVYVENTGTTGTTLTWTADVDPTAAGWLGGAPLSGSVAGAGSEEFVVSVDASSLGVGTHTGVITFVGVDQATGLPATDGSATVAVTIEVSAVPLLSASPGVLAFDDAVRGTSNPIPDTQQVTVTSNVRTSDWSAVIPGGETWLSVTPSSGTLAMLADEVVSVTVDTLTGDLPAGDYEAEIRFVDQAAPWEYATVVVRVNVDDASAFAISPDAIEFVVRDGEGDPAAQSLSIANAGALTLDWTLSESLTWLDVSPLSGSSTSTPDVVSVSASVAGLSSGIYSGFIYATSASAVNSPLYVPVKLRITGQTIWVAMDGDDATGDGSELAPYRTISVGLAAASAHDIVMVKPGVYSQPVSIATPGVTLKGQEGPGRTVISGPGAGTSLNGVTLPTSTETTRTTFEGFTVTGWQVGIMAGAGSIVRDCIVEQNRGCGISAVCGCSTEILGNIVRDHQEDGFGAMFSCRDDGSSGVSVVANNLICGGAGFRTAVMIDISYSSQTVRFENNTVAHNKMGGVELSTTEVGVLRLYMVNNLVAFNDGAGIDLSEGRTPTLFAAHNVFGNEVNYLGMTERTGISDNISGDPGFIDCRLCRLHPESPCADAGRSTQYHGGVDLAGSARVSGVAIDIGCYELDELRDTISATPTRIELRGHVEHAPEPGVVVLVNVSDETASWSAVDDASWLTLSASSGTLAPGGGEHLTVQADVGGMPEGAYCAKVTLSDPSAVWRDIEIAVVLQVGATIYVDTSGDDGGLGTSADPFETIGHALSVCAPESLIVVRPGAYDETLTVTTNGVTLRSEGGAAVTSIVGGAPYSDPAITVDAADRVTIDKLTIRYGHGSVHAFNCSRISVINCIIESSWDTALRLDFSDGTRVIGNVIRNCTNSSMSYYVPSAIDINTSYFDEYPAVIANNLLIDNERDALHIGGSSTENEPPVFILNNTITGTEHHAVRLGGDASNTVVANNVICGNGIGVDLEAFPIPDFHHNDVWGNGAEYVDGRDLSGEAGNISLDPQFMDEAGGDYRLRSSSPCRDAGWSEIPHMPRLDIRGMPRLSGGAVDMGCYEYQSVDGAFEFVQDELVFGNAVEGVHDPRPSASQAATILNESLTSGDWVVDVIDGGSWLSISQAFGTLAAGASTDITVTVEPVAAMLAAGSYVATLRVHPASDATQYAELTVRLDVAAQSGITVFPSALTFQATTGGVAPATQTVTVGCGVSGGVAWTVSDDAAWLYADVSSGFAETGLDPVVLYADTTGLSAGTYVATVQVDDAAAVHPSAYVSVTVYVRGDGIWVASDGSDLTGDGSFANPYASPSTAARYATGGQSIFVCPGTYHDSLTIGSDDVTLCGLGEPESTVIRCDDWDTVVDVEHRSYVVIRGLTLRAGEHSVATDYSANLLVTDCAFEQTTGEAFYLEYAEDALIAGNVFSGCNTAILMRKSGNTSTIVVSDNLIVDTITDAVYISGTNDPCDMRLVNNTIVGSQGAGIYTSHYVAGFVVANNMVCDNAVGIRADAYETTIWMNNNVSGNVVDWDDPADDVTGTDGNLAVPPQFVDAAGGDYRIPSGSSCREAGDNTYVGTTEDVRGSPRIVDGDGDTTATVDIGCYEWQPSDP